MPATRIVYLLHFKRPLAHAKHYLGSTNNLEMRLNAHNHGGGSRLTQVAHDLGIEFELVRTWPSGGRKLERKLKNQHNGRRLCPKCHAKYLAQRRKRYKRARKAAK
jgi:predicted GIY-YIG superfamily endonuclease